MEGIFKDFIDYRLNWHLKGHVLCLTRFNRTYEHATNAKYAERGLAMVELSFIFLFSYGFVNDKTDTKKLTTV